MKITAIDFEHAGRVDHPISVGIVTHESGVRTEFRSLINPEIRSEDWLPTASRIHGLKPDDVKDAPPFPDLWPEIESHLEDSLVIAHWVQADINVIRKNISRYKLPFEPFFFLDTWDIAKHTWSELENWKLKTLARHLSIELDHHEPLSDARACMEIFMKASADYVFEKAADVEFIFGNQIIPARLFGFNSLNKEVIALGLEHFGTKSTIKYEPKDPEFRLKDGLPLSGMTFVFTGSFSNFDQPYAEQVVQELGGSLGRGRIKADLSYLVCGTQDPKRLKAGNSKSTKQLQAEALIADGASIQIIPERDFLAMIIDES